MPHKENVDILIITTSDIDGAGLHSIYQKDLLIKLGYSVQIICLEKQSNDINTEGLFKSRGWELFKWKLKRKKHNFLYRKISERYVFIHSYLPNQKKILRSNIWPGGCKLIICNYLSGMMTFKTLHYIWLKYKKAKIIFCAVDQELVSGGCHYVRECKKYQKVCISCPALPKSKTKQIENYFREKQKYIQFFKNHIVIVCSEADKNLFKKSSLFSKSDIRKILMPIDKNLYGNYDENKRSLLRRTFSWEENFVIMLRSSAELRKGCREFIKALNLLAEKDPIKLSRIQLVLVGDDFVKKELSNLNLKIFSAGYIKQKSKLADLYALADIFVNPSLADSGPSMLAQATMSGTPSITNNVGLASDLISLNGIILKNTKVEELYKAITKMMELSKNDLDKMRTLSRKKGLDLISEEKYLNVTKKLMSELIDDDI